MTSFSCTSLKDRCCTSCLEDEYFGYEALPEGEIHGVEFVACCAHMEEIEEWTEEELKEFLKNKEDKLDEERTNR